MYNLDFKFKDNSGGRFRQFRTLDSAKSFLSSLGKESLQMVQLSFPERPPFERSTPSYETVYGYDEIMRII